MGGLFGGGVRSMAPVSNAGNMLSGLNNTMTGSLINASPMSYSMPSFSTMPNATRTFINTPLPSMTPNQQVISSMPNTVAGRQASNLLGSLNNGTFQNYAPAMRLVTGQSNQNFLGSLRDWNRVSNHPTLASGVQGGIDLGGSKVMYNMSGPIGKNALGLTYMNTPGTGASPSARPSNTTVAQNIPGYKNTKRIASGRY